MDDSDQRNDEAGALKRIKEAHSTGGWEVNASLESLSKASFGRTRTIVLQRRFRGPFVWRIDGKAGADLPKHPLAIEIENLEKKHRTEINKVERFLRLLAANKNKSGVSARKVKTDLVKETILQLVRNAPARHHGRNLSGYLSKQTGLSRRQIQRYLYQIKAT